ncbi:hypothetical protein AAKU52_003152 [Pedobacter sp. CG_S7]|uniref:transposase n=1 Tax=Pedobacter sp. CG_S7 TaxID=3143930 RepID=UPI0033951D3D
MSVSIGLTPANIHDVHYVNHLDKNQLHDCELIADKGYLSVGYQASLFEQDRIRLITPLRANMKRRESLWNPAYRYTRKRIETCSHSFATSSFLIGTMPRHWTAHLQGCVPRSAAWRFCNTSIS